MKFTPTSRAYSWPRGDSLMKLRHALSLALLPLCLSSCATRALFTATPKSRTEDNVDVALLPAALVFDAGTLPLQLLVGFGIHETRDRIRPIDVRSHPLPTTPNLHRWELLIDASKDSLARGHDTDAKFFAEELELATPQFKNDSQYGDAVQSCNIVLGRLALKAGDVPAARRRLLAAGRSPGSAVLDSFGPNMTLAKDLLTKNEKKVVVQYLELCRIFWKYDEGKLDRWKADVVAGRAPDFGANLDY